MCTHGLRPAVGQILDSSPWGSDEDSCSSHLSSMASKEPVICSQEAPSTQGC